MDNDLSGAAGTPDNLDRLWAPHRIAYLSGENRPLPTNDVPCPFCRVPTLDDAEGLIVARGTTAYVVMNLYPYNCGHLMVIPYLQTPDFSDLDQETKLEVMELTDLSIKALKLTLRPQGFNVGANLGRVAGGSVDTHIHFHIVPRWEGDTNFMPVLADAKVLSNDMHSTYSNLKKAFADLTQVQG